MVERLANSETNAKRIQYVEQCFGSSGQPLAIANRVLVGEGVLTKMCRKKPKPRQFFLFNDILVYGNIMINKRKYNQQHIIPLELVKLQSIKDEGNLHNGWQIISPRKSFCVYAATATEKEEWMKHINKCAADLLAKHGQKHQQMTDSPVWVPDGEAPLCMRCQRSEFNLLNRRHHCRHCGHVVCGNCSTKRWLLPEQSSKPLRVCDLCYDRLGAVAHGSSRPAASNADDSPDSSSEEDEACGVSTAFTDKANFYQNS